MLHITDYSEKSFAVTGDTKECKDALKAMGGSYNPRLTCGKGWIFSNKQRAAVEEYIRTGKVTPWVSARHTQPLTLEELIKRIIIK